MHPSCRVSEFILKSAVSEIHINRVNVPTLNYFDEPFLRKFSEVRNPQFRMCRKLKQEIVSFIVC